MGEGLSGQFPYLVQAILQILNICRIDTPGFVGPLCILIQIIGASLEHDNIVCTHVDKRHIHSHIVFNSTALDCTKKFRNFWRSSFAIRKISDMLCLENGLSVIAVQKPSRGSYGTWLGEDKPPTVRGSWRD